MTIESDLRCRVVREAAALLYCGAEKEYKQAKQRAAQTLGTHFLPSNFEVACELDRIAEEKEGTKRSQRLIEMRKQALDIMRFLDAYCPVLVGSVWRGTIRQGSDIDIAAYADDPQEIVNQLRGHGVKISRTAWTSVNKHGVTLSSFHIYAETDSGQGFEIVVRSREEAGKKRKCEIFGDELRGLKRQELEKILKSNPAQRFIPE